MQIGEQGEHKNETKKVFKQFYKPSDKCKICGSEIVDRSYVRTSRDMYHTNCYGSMVIDTTLKEISVTIKDVRSYHGRCPWSNHSVYRKNAESKVFPEHNATPEYFEFIHSRGNTSPLVFFGYQCSTCIQILQFDTIHADNIPNWNGD